MTDDNAALEDAQLGTEEGAEGNVGTEGDEGSNEQSDAMAKLKEAIEVSAEDVGTLRKKISVTIPRDALDEKLKDQYTELKRETVLPGFRKGHAPQILIERRFGTEVGDQVVTDMVSTSFMAAMEKIEIKPLGDPLIWADVPVEKGGTETESKLLGVEEALPYLKLPESGPLTYFCEVELHPEFELPDLDGIPVEKPTVQISDEDVTSEIDRFRQMRGRFAPVDGAIEADDLIVADAVVTVDGKQVADLKNETIFARTQVLEGVLLEDMGKSLVGKKAGDSATVETTVGDDHEKGEWRGKKVEVALTLHDVKRLELPELDAEMLDSIGYDSEQEFRDHVRQTLEDRLSDVVQRGLRGQISQFLVEKTAIVVPSGLSQRQTERIVSRRMIEMYQQGVPQQEIEKQLDELRVTASKDAVDELKHFFILEKIAEEMDIDVADDEVNGAIAMIAQQQGKRFDRVRDELTKGNGLMSLFLQLRDAKILDLLLGKAAIKEVDGPKTKAKKGAAAESSGKKAKSSGEKTSKKKTADSKAGSEGADSDGADSEGADSDGADSEG